MWRRLADFMKPHPVAVYVAPSSGTFCNISSVARDQIEHLTPEHLIRFCHKCRIHPRCGEDQLTETSPVRQHGVATFTSPSWWA